MNYSAQKTSSSDYNNSLSINGKEEVEVSKNNKNNVSSTGTDNLNELTTTTTTLHHQNSISPAKKQDLLLLSEQQCHKQEIITKTSVHEKEEDLISAAAASTIVTKDKVTVTKNSFFNQKGIYFEERQLQLSSAEETLMVWPSSESQPQDTTDTATYTEFPTELNHHDYSATVVEAIDDIKQTSLIYIGNPWLTAVNNFEKPLCSSSKRCLFSKLCSKQQLLNHDPCNNHKQKENEGYYCRSLLHQKRTSYNLNRFTVLVICLLLTSTTGSFFFNWPSTQKLILRSGAYSWLCHEGDPLLLAPDERLGGKPSLEAALVSIPAQQWKIGDTVYESVPPHELSVLLRSLAHNHFFQLSNNDSIKILDSLNNNNNNNIDIQYEEKKHWNVNNNTTTVSLVSPPLSAAPASSSSSFSSYLSLFSLLTPLSIIMDSGTSNTSNPLPSGKLGFLSNERLRSTFNLTPLNSQVEIAGHNNTDEIIIISDDDYTRVNDNFIKNTIMEPLLSASLLSNQGGLHTLASILKEHYKKHRAVIDKRNISQPIQSHLPIDPNNNIVVFNNSINSAEEDEQALVEELEKDGACLPQVQAVNSLMPIGVATWFCFSFVGGIAVDICGPKMTSTLGLCLSATGWLLLSFCTQQTPFYVPAFILLGSGVDVIFIGTLSIANLFPGYRGTVVSLFNAARSLAFAIPAIMYAVLDSWPTLTLREVSVVYSCMVFGWITVVLVIIPWRPYKSNDQNNLVVTDDPQYSTSDTVNQHKDNRTTTFTLDKTNNFIHATTHAKHHYVTTNTKGGSHKSKCNFLMSFSSIRSSTETNAITQKHCIRDENINDINNLNRHYITEKIKETTYTEQPSLYSDISESRSNSSSFRALSTHTSLYCHSINPSEDNNTLRMMTSQSQQQQQQRLGLIHDENYTISSQLSKESAGGSDNTSSFILSDDLHKENYCILDKDYLSLNNNDPLYLKQQQQPPLLSKQPSSSFPEKKCTTSLSFHNVNGNDLFFNHIDNKDQPKEKTEKLLCNDIKIPESKEKDFFTQRLTTLYTLITSSLFFPIIPYAILTVIRGGFLANSASDQLGPFVNLFAILTPLSFIPAPMFGYTVDRISIHFVFLILNSLGTLQFLCLILSTQFLLGLAATLHLFISSFFLGQIYCYITFMFPPEYAGTLIGLVICLSGLFGLLVTPMYNFSTNSKSFLLMDIVCLGFCIICYGCIFVLWKAAHNSFCFFTKR